MTILVPYEIAERNNPAFNYESYLSNAVVQIEEYHGNHYTKFPERREHLPISLVDLFNKSVHDCVMLREEAPLDEGVFTIQSKLIKKDECVEVNIMMHV